MNYDIGQAVGRWAADGTGASVTPIHGLPPGARPQSLSFSPSGQRVAILSDFKQYFFGSVAPSELRAEIPLSDGFSYVSGGAWVSENVFILVGKRGTSFQELWSFDLESGDTRRVPLEGFALRDFVAVSPDGGSLVFCGLRNSTGKVAWSLWRFSLRTHEVFQLTTGTEDVSPSWRAG
jgi:Tol biopolymer transport system component